MSRSVKAPAQALGVGRVKHLAGWRVHEYATVPSTNLVAAPLPIWNAVRADAQTAGRGRFQRQWLSDPGGLWLSAVVPAPAGASWTALLPLLGGLAVCDALHRLGVAPLRMRWPNDVLSEHGKLAGLLVDQFTPGRAVIGIGINVENRPDLTDPTLRGQVVRMAELLMPCPALQKLMSEVLEALRAVCSDAERLGPGHLLPRINALWQAPRPVRLEAEAATLSGRFEGIDAAGRLRLSCPSGETQLFEPHQVRLLRDV